MKSKKKCLMCFYGCFMSIYVRGAYSIFKFIKGDHSKKKLGKSALKSLILKHGRNFENLEKICQKHLATVINTTSEFKLITS